MDIGAVVLALDPDSASGDAVLVEELGGRILLGVFDGLGHGPMAKEASEAGLACVRSNLARPLPEIMQACDAALRATRGAAAGLATIDSAKGELAYIGVGNTRIRVLGDGRDEPVLLSTPGIVGAGIGAPQAQAAPYDGHATIIMCTDGIRPRFDLTAYSPGILGNAQRLAEAIATEFRREADDAAVLVMRSAP